MQNFTYQNPVKVVFGKGVIAQLASLIPQTAKVMLTYGGGSIKRNGVYDQVRAALKNHQVVEFPGIEPNPRYETCMQAVEQVRRDDVQFLLAVGGGSVLDGTKFIAAAARFEGADPWDIVVNGAPVAAAVPLGAVLTLPATGSEMNGFSVVSRAATAEKLAFGSEHCYPKFSIMDPETTYSLPPRQVGNGIVDTFAHVAEQYATTETGGPLQARQAEAILQTLIEEAPKVFATPQDYDVRANLMWCATNALNGLINCGVIQDWSTHMIGHELTAFYGLDHGQTLAVVLPGIWAHRKAAKIARLTQYAERVWSLRSGSAEAKVDEAIARTRGFFESVGVKTRLSDYGIDAAEAAAKISARFAARGTNVGENGAITPDQLGAILQWSK